MASSPWRGYRAASPKEALQPQLRCRHLSCVQGTDRGGSKKSPPPSQEARPPYRPPMDDHHQWEGGVEGTPLERLLLAWFHQAALLRPLGIQQELGLEVGRASPLGRQSPRAWKRPSAKGFCPPLALQEAGCGLLGFWVPRMPIDPPSAACIPFLSHPRA